MLVFDSLINKQFFEVSKYVIINIMYFETIIIYGKNGLEIGGKYI